MSIKYGSFIDLLKKDNFDDEKKDTIQINNYEQKKINRDIFSKKENKKSENQDDIKNIKLEENIPLIEETNEDSCLNYLPMTNNYSISYLQSDIIDNIFCTNKTDIIFTTSNDGVIQFWKKLPKGIEFLKKFKSHLNKITGNSINNGFPL